jgi:hypothetical protein
LTSERLVSCSSAQKPASGSCPLYAGRRLPSHQAPDRLVPEEIRASGFDDIRFFSTRHRRVCFRSSPGHTPARSHAPSFCSNAHHHGFWPQRLGVVWDPSLKTDPEGPTLIFHAAVRHVSNSCCPPFFVSLQHTEAQEFEGLRFSEPNLSASARRMAAKFDQACLVRMERQRELL